MGWFEGRRVGELFKVILVGAVPDVHFKLGDLFRTTLARLPIARVLFGKVEAAEREPPVIARADLAGVREENVLTLVTADPVAAALGLEPRLARFAT